MKHFLPLALILLLLLTACTASAADEAFDEERYRDISEGEWYSEAVYYCLAKEIINPAADNVFLPDEPLTRAEAALALWRMDGSPQALGDVGFADVRETSDYREAVRWAADTSLMSGYSNRVFGAEDPLNREQMAAILYRYEEHSGKAAAAGSRIAFSDGDQISPWALKAVSWAYDKGILTGRPGNLFVPEDAVTRAEAAVMLHRYLIIGEDSAQSPAEADDTALTDVEITVDGRSFAAKFYDNEASEALLRQMPLTLSMSDLNRNEKYHYLPENLPSASSERPAVIHAGDIMCWSGNCLVLFYETFSNDFGGYVRLGYIADPDGLSEALGSGAVEVVFKKSPEQPQEAAQ